MNHCPNSKGKAVKKDIFLVKNLALNKPIETVHEFSSGGTKLQLRFRIEKTGGGVLLSEQILKIVSNFF